MAEGGPNGEEVRIARRLDGVLPETTELRPEGVTTDDRKTETGLYRLDGPYDRGRGWSTRFL